MTLTEALHHSAGPSTKKVVERREKHEEVEFETHAALRGHNPPPPGSRPGVLLDHKPPWVDAVTVGYVAGGAPLMGVPSLADSSAEAIDGRTLRFLLKQNLARKEEEEEMRRKLEEAEHEASLLRLSDRACAGEPLTADEHAALRRWSGLPPKKVPMRKRKKRKKKHPKISSARAPRIRLWQFPPVPGCCLRFDSGCMYMR